MVKNTKIREKMPKITDLEGKFRSRDLLEILFFIFKPVVGLLNLRFPHVLNSKMPNGREILKIPISTLKTRFLTKNHRFIW